MKTKLELDAINNMMDRAIEVGMQVEVIYTFGERRAAGDDIIEACRCALHEWDC